MDRKTILALYDKEQRIDIEYPDLHKEVTGDVVRFTGPAERHSSNFVLYSRLTDENAKDVIGEQVAFYGRYGLPFEWKVYDHDTPSDLRARLLMQGFKARERDAIMVLDIHAASPILLQPVKADVRRLGDPRQVKDLIALLETVWQTDFSGLGQSLQEDLWKRPSYSSIYLAYVDDHVGWYDFAPVPRARLVYGRDGHPCAGSHSPRLQFPDHRRLAHEPPHRREIRFSTPDLCPCLYVATQVAIEGPAPAIPGHSCLPHH
jgi:hypothetical protein